MGERRLWLSLSVFHCLRCHCLAAAAQDLGDEECVEVLALTSLQRAGTLREKQPQPNRVRLLSMEFRKAQQERAVWYFISMLWKCDCDCSSNTSVCMGLRALPNLLLGWLGGWDLSIWALFGSCTGSTGAFRLPGSHGSPSYSEVICLPFLFYLVRFAAAGFLFGSIFLNVTLRSFWTDTNREQLKPWL